MNLTPARHRLLDRLLEQALDLDEPERERFLQRCLDRAPRVGRRLRRLVAASAAPTRFLEGAGGRLMGQAPEDSVEPALPSGTRLGPWRLLERVGAGGMGQVYRAERADGAFEMQAAIKLILTRRRELVEVLERERQLLARLSHPAIARLLDGGVTEDDRPYLVMEWVEGQDLGDWVAREMPSVTGVLDRFHRVVEAIAAAHRALVVHGDIKPANIRIQPDGQVRLLDFGLARFQSDRAESDRVLALTPGFSAPELLAGEPPSVRTDIYSLGKLLAWLMGDSAESRRPDPDRHGWARHPRGRDLAAISARAAAEDPSDRYASTEELLGDLECLGDHRPTRARPPGPGRRLALWIRRHRVPAAAGLLVALGLVASITHALWQSAQTRAEADRALTASRHAEAVNEFLVSLFEHADPFATGGEDVTARELLEQGIERIEMLEETPGVQVQMLRELARVSRLLGHYDAAADLLGDARRVAGGESGVDRGVRAVVVSELGGVLEDKGELGDALSAHDRALEILSEDDESGQAALRAKRAQTLIAKGRYAQAEAALERARDYQESRDDQAVELAATLNIEGALHSALDDHESALEAFEQALEINREHRGDSHEATLTQFGNVANALMGLGHHDQAIEQYREQLEIRRRLLGSDHPDVATTLYQIGLRHLHDGRAEEAEPYLREAVEIREKVLPGGHPSLIRSQNALAGVMRKNQDLEGAERAVLAALLGAREAHGSDHLQTASILAHLAVVRMDRGDHASSRALHLLALQMRLNLVGEVHSHVANSYRGLARTAHAGGRPERAMDWAERALDNHKSQHSDEDHPDIRRSRELLDEIREVL